MANRFLIYGLFGWFLEIIWTGICSLISGDKRLKAQTSLYMFFIYGLFVFAEPVCVFFSDFNFVFRGFIYLCLIFTAEFYSGLLIRKTVGVCPWDYSADRYNLCGLIRLDYAPCWFICGLAYERLFYFLTDFGL